MNHRGVRSVSRGMQRRTMTRALALAAAALLTLGVAACGDDDDDAADTGDDTTTTAEETTEDTEDTADESPVVDPATVVAQDFTFTVPDSVAAGSTVTFDNQDAAPHTMTADEGDAFDSGNVSGGSQGEVTAPAEPGSYPFHCEVHPNMQATLTVV
jgi:plastocyanin